MAVGRIAVLVPASAVLLCGVGVLFASVVPIVFMMVSRLAMVMGGSLVVRRGVVVVLAGWMFCGSHGDFSSVVTAH
jgi:hypothetical protein